MRPEPTSLHRRHAAAALLDAAAFLAAAACGLLIGAAFFYFATRLPYLLVDSSTDHQSHQSTDLRYVATDLLLYLAPIVGTLGAMILIVLTTSVVRRRLGPRRNRHAATR